MLGCVAEAHPQRRVVLGPHPVGFAADVALVVQSHRHPAVGRRVGTDRGAGRVRRRGRGICGRWIRGTRGIPRPHRAEVVLAAKSPAALLQVLAGVPADREGEQELLLRRDVSSHLADSGGLGSGKDDRGRVGNVAEVVTGELTAGDDRGHRRGGGRPRRCSGFCGRSGRQRCGSADDPGGGQHDHCRYEHRLEEIPHRPPPSVGRDCICRDGAPAAAHFPNCRR